MRSWRVGWDPHYGARLGRDLRAAGLSDVHTECITRRHPGGSLGSRLLSLTLERLRERMVLLGADEGEVDEARRQLADPANMITSPTRGARSATWPGVRTAGDALATRVP